MSDTYQATVTVERIVSTNIEGEPSNTTGLLHVTVSASTPELLKARVANVLSVLDV